MAQSRRLCRLLSSPVRRFDRPGSLPKGSVLILRVQLSDTRLVRVNPIGVRTGPYALIHIGPGPLQSLGWSVTKGPVLLQHGLLHPTLPSASVNFFSVGGTREGFSQLYYWM